MNRTLILCVALLSGLTFAQSYCVPIANAFDCSFSGGDEYIANVTISNLNNSSSCTAQPGYEDFTASVSPVSLVPGQSYVITVLDGNAWDWDTVYIMFDIDGNGIFDTTLSGGELLATMGPLANLPGGPGTTFQTLTTTIAIPPSATTASRLRVRLSWGPLAPGNEACDTAGWGNCEDYATTPAGAGQGFYQVNQPSASLDVDGVNGTAYTAADVVRCPDTNFAVNIASPLVGLPFDLLFSTASLVPRGGGALTTPSGNQVVNIDLNSFSFLLGGFATNFPGNFTLSASFPTFIPGIYTQMAIIDPTNVDLVSLSQPNGLHIAANGSLVGFIPPVGDEQITTLPVPACLSFYGAWHNDVWVSTNGRIGFGTNPSGVWFPTVLDAMSGDPSVGYWCDLDVVPTASVTATNPSNGLTRLQWNNVAYWGTAVTITFGIQFDGNTDSVTIDMLPSISSSGSWALLGVSAGASASDPGSVIYTAGGFPTSGLGMPAPNPGMIYSYAQQGSGLTGIYGITFYWNPVSGNYDWISY